MNEAIASKEKIAGRLKSGLARTALSQIIIAATAIALVPLYIAAWGVDGYGRWLSLTAVIAYLSLLDLGGQNYVGNLLAGAYAPVSYTHLDVYKRQALAKMDCGVNDDTSCDLRLAAIPQHAGY